MPRTCRACDQAILPTSRFPSLCGPCGEESLNWNRKQPVIVPNDWPRKINMDWADWDWDSETDNGFDLYELVLKSLSPA